jgi:hypothetical protein
MPPSRNATAADDRRTATHHVGSPVADALGAPLKNVSAKGRGGVQALERAPLLPKVTWRAGAGRAFRDVIEPPALLRELAVAAGKTELGAVAGAAFSSSSARDRRARKRGSRALLGEVEGLRDLVVRPPLELAAHGSALVLGIRCSARTSSPSKARCFLRPGDRDELHFGRARLLLAESLAHDCA